MSPRQLPASRNQPWKLRQPKNYILTNANLVDPESGQIHSGVSVSLSGGLIKSIAPTNSLGHADDASLQGATEINVQGKYLCPGLFDAHVHLAATPGEENWRDTRDVDECVSAHRQAFICKQMLARGFTTVRDCGGVGQALKNALEVGLIRGPRVFIAGAFLSQTGGHGDLRSSWDMTDPRCCGMNRACKAHICDGIPECLKAARQNLRTGSDFLKIMGGGGLASPSDHISNIQFTAEEIRAITTVAKNNQTYVTSHAYTPASIRQAIENGVMAIEHGNFLDRETAKLMAEAGAFLTPTLAVYHIIAEEEEYLPPESVRKNSEVLEAGLECLKIAHEAGVTMCYGSDMLGHLMEAQSEEFAIRAKVLSATAILQSATINPARMSGKADSIGQIKPGFLADVLILNSNPLDDITILSRPEKHILAVIKDGRVNMSRWSKMPEDMDAFVECLE